MNWQETGATPPPPPPPFFISFWIGSNEHLVMAPQSWVPHDSASLSSLLHGLIFKEKFSGSQDLKRQVCVTLSCCPSAVHSGKVLVKASYTRILWNALFVEHVSWVVRKKGDYFCAVIIDSPPPYKDCWYVERKGMKSSVTTQTASM